ncbi:MAG: HD domain-containing phosphohydrolase [Rhodospirillales bacterium]
MDQDNQSIIPGFVGDKRQFFSDALETVGAVVVVVDLEGRIVYANKACEEETLSPVSEIEGKHIWDFFSADEVKASKKVVERVLETSATHRLETHWHSRYDTERLIDWSVNATRQDGGDTDFLVFSGLDVTDRKRAEDTIRNDAEHLHQVFINTVQAFMHTVEIRDPYTAGHQERVSELATAIAHEMNVPDAQIEGIQLGSKIHDIGKIYVPAEILNRPGRITDNERNIIKTHPQVGKDILKGLTFPWPIVDMVYQHHERIDGTGYPEGLKGDEITLEAKIISVADVIEAISSHRPYRPALGIERGIDVIKEGRGKFFDEAVADACLKLITEKGFDWEKD